MPIFIAHAETKAPGIVEGLDKIIPGGFANIFSFGLQIGLAIAFGTIIYAGFLYLIAGDNPSKTKEANAWIMAAVEGLIILAGAFILLNTINPKLTTIKEVEIPELEQISFNGPLVYAGTGSLLEPPTDLIQKLPNIFSVADGIGKNQISDVTGYRILEIDGRRVCSFHRGMDLQASCGTVIRAMGDGVVSFAGLHEAYGGLVVVSHTNGLQTYYAHLQRINISSGADIKSGEEIGISGGQKGMYGSGYSTGCHLHIEVRNGDNAYNLVNLFGGTAQTIAEAQLGEATANNCPEK